MYSYFQKFTVEQTILEFKITAILIFILQVGEQKKQQNAPIVTTNQITTEVLSKPKNPKDYQYREVH